MVADPLKLLSCGWDKAVENNSLSKLARAARILSMDASVVSRPIAASSFVRVNSHRSKFVTSSSMIRVGGLHAHRVHVDALHKVAAHDRLYHRRRPVFRSRRIGTILANSCSSLAVTLTAITKLQPLLTSTSAGTLFTKPPSTNAWPLRQIGRTDPAD